ncbi:DEAD/DEAH box helicase family protein [Zeaxanthinibacter sp. PT1]|uniref:DEAD/DEAH box helicase n=1 Tax=Zeaxanthinibacter TaxID=561554 RepID=UPI002349AF06|nr:DEAD/DEAH box helicase family protein [Zeaxanthinibacter sp. PT1]MDC6350731.1 DEAD/DEAH box helicase family protein [Zeaxanthinibacter sp. PT1]
MKIDKVKLKRQQGIIEKWKSNRAKGTLEAVTGFGKTFVALLIIQDMNERRPDRSALVIVPTQALKKQWKGKIKEMKLINVTVEVVNTVIKKQWQTDLLVCDEVHNYAAKSYQNVFKCIRYKFILGLTATLERADNRHVIINSRAPVIDKVDMKEALANGYVSDFRVFNLGLEMDEKDRKEYKRIGDLFHKYFAFFSHDFDTAMRCLSDASFRKLYAERMGWEDRECFIFALNFNRNMQARKKFLYYANSKVEAAVKLIETFQVPTITFAQSTTFCDRIMEEIPKISVTYHSEMKAKERRESMAKFKDGRTKVRVIHTAMSLDEGFDVNGIEMALICSGTSSGRQDLQRTGRAIRYSEGKLGLIVNLYIKNTQDEKWLRSRQGKAENVVWVDSIDEIKNQVQQLKAAI